MAAMEIRHPDRLIAHVTPSSLLAEYRATAEKAKESRDYDDAAAMRAMAVVEDVDRLMGQQLRRGVALGFPEVARRVDLLSPSLIDDVERRSDGTGGD